MPVSGAIAPVLLLATGLLFAAAGALLSAVARRRLPVLAYFALGSILAAVVAWFGLVDWPAAAGTPRLGGLIACLGAAGVCNVIGFIAMARALAGGRSAVAWTIGQSALLVPFLVSLVLWEERAGAWGWSGLGLLLLGMMVLARGRSDHGGAPRIGAALLAFAAYGLAQSLASIPSHWPDGGDPAGLRLPINLTANALAATVAMLWRGERPVRALTPWIAGYAAVLLGAFLAMFTALDRLAQHGAAGVAWPVACGVGILGYAGWSRLVHRERLARTELAGLVLVIGGIAALAARTL